MIEIVETAKAFLLFALQAIEGNVIRNTHEFLKNYGGKA